MHVNPYLMFDGRTEEALAFYQQAIGAEVTVLMRFKENPEPPYNPPGSDEMIMHAGFMVGDSMIMATDGECGGKANFGGISLALTVPTAGEAEKLFLALLDGGGKEQMPMTETFFAERFGVVADKFGVSWMVLGGGKV